ncbi:MAG: hypothetical protein WCP03_00280 [Candidatus Saccharibacteria bacterium]
MNNPVTRHDLQLLLQQTVSTILNKTITHDEFNNIAQSINQRMCCKQDAQNYIEASKQKILERVLIPINEQQVLNQQLIAQIDIFGKYLARLDQKIDNLQKSINIVQSETETTMSRNQNNPARTVLEQLYA